MYSGRKVQNSFKTQKNVSIDGIRVEIIAMHYGIDGVKDKQFSHKIDWKCCGNIICLPPIQYHNALRYFQLRYCLLQKRSFERKINKL